MTSTRFVSNAQNGEDVVLWRVFASIEHGTYLDIGANHPSKFSVTRSFYDRGWSGLAVEPEPSLAALFTEQRPRDVLVQGVVSDEPGTLTLHTFAGTGLSTLDDDISAGHVADGRAVSNLVVDSFRLEDLIERNGFGGRDIHFMVVDTEGAEKAVLMSMNFARYRPWVLVIEATAPNTTSQVHGAWESIVLAADYEFCLFDGLSRFYVAAERSIGLKERLSYPVCVFDDFIHVDELAIRDRIVQLERELEESAATIEAMKRELAEERGLRETVSWRITAPLRAVRHWQLVRRDKPREDQR